MGNIGRPEYIPNGLVKATLSWTGSGVALAYKVQLEKYEGGAWGGTQNLVALGESRILQVHANTKYRFRVAERGPFSDGDWSDWVEFTPKDKAEASSLDPDDLGLGLVCGAGYIDLVWSDHPDLGGVAIYASTQGSPTWEDFREFVPRPAGRWRFPTQVKTWFLAVVWDWAGRRVGEKALEGSPVGLGIGDDKAGIFGGQVLLLEAEMAAGTAGDMTELESGFIAERVEIFLKESTGAAQKIRLEFGPDYQEFTLGTSVGIYNFREGILFARPYAGGTPVGLSAPSTNTETVSVKVRVWGRTSSLVVSTERMEVRNGL